MTATASKLSPSEISAAIKREPLITVAEACRIMGVRTSNFRRDYVDRPDPKLDEIELAQTGGRPIRLYFRSQVRQLARKRNGN